MREGRRREFAPLRRLPRPRRPRGDPRSERTRAPSRPRRLDWRRATPAAGRRLARPVPAAARDPPREIVPRLAARARPRRHACSATARDGADRRRLAARRRRPPAAREPRRRAARSRAAARRTAGDDLRHRPRTGAGPLAGRCARREAATASERAPRATYRLQFSPTSASPTPPRSRPTSRALGVSHVYASPFFAARPGSTHGYDIVDHNALNPELGGEADFARHGRRRSAPTGLGQILDFVPNHMGVGGADNPCWLDVLEWGQDSRLRRLVRHRLGRRPSAASPASCWCPSSATSTARCWRTASSSCASTPAKAASRSGPTTRTSCRSARCTTPAILGDGGPAGALGDASPAADWRRRRRHAPRLKPSCAGLAEPRPPAADRGALAGVQRPRRRPGSWRALDALIQRPALARRRTSASRRRHQLPPLLQHQRAGRAAHGGCRRCSTATHRLVLGLLAEGVLDGLRIDHIDGLLDPKGYCSRLRERAPRPFYLRGREDPRAPRAPARGLAGADGTTGYEFANLVAGLLVDPGRRPRRSAAPTRASPAATPRRRGDRARVQARDHGRARWRASSTCCRARLLALAARRPAHRDFTRDALRAGAERDRRRPRSTAPTSTPTASAAEDRARHRLGGSRGAAPRRRRSTPASSTSCTRC